MSNYSDEEKAAILDAAFATLARTAHIAKSDNLSNLPPPPTETYNQRVRRELTEADAEQQREREHRLTDFEAAALEARVRAELAGMVEGERNFMLELMAEMLACNRREISEAVGSLRADVTVARAIDRAENVTELPAIPLRKST